MSTNKINDGGPAFPSGNLPESEFYLGLTTRDWFAGQASQAYLSNLTYGAELQRMFDPDNKVGEAGDKKESPLDYVARLSYAYADAMIAAREAKGTS